MTAFTFADVAFVAPPAVAAGLSIVQAKAAQGTGNRSVVLDATPTNGNTLVAAGSYSSTSAGDITDLTGWTLVLSLPGPGASPSMKLWTKTVSGDPATVSMTVAASAGSTLQVVEVAATSGIDQSTSATNTTTPITATTGSTSTANQLALSFLVCPGSYGTLTVNNGFVSLGGTAVTVRSAIASKSIPASSTAVTSSYSWTNSVAGSEIVATFKP